MDEFVNFNYLLLDASAGPGAATVVERDGRQERVDLIARQLRDFLQTPSPAGDAPRGLLLSDDFKLRGSATRDAGWLAFLVDRGDGRTERLEEVARLAFVRREGQAAEDVVRRLGPDVGARQLPPAPLAVAVLLVRDVPSIITDLLPKAAAAYFSEEFAPPRAV